MRTFIEFPYISSSRSGSGIYAQHLMALLFSVRHNSIQTQRIVRVLFSLGCTLIFRRGDHQLQSNETKIFCFVRHPGIKFSFVARLLFEFSFVTSFHWVVHQDVTGLVKILDITGLINIMGRRYFPLQSLESS